MEEAVRVPRHHKYCEHCRADYRNRVATNRLTVDGHTYSVCDPHTNAIVQEMIKRRQAWSVTPIDQTPKPKEEK